MVDFEFHGEDIVIWDLQTESWINTACGIANRNLSYTEWQQYLPGTPYHLTCPDLPSDLYTFNQMIKVAEDALKANDLSTSQYLYQELVNRAQQTDNYILQNTVCWFGSLDGYAKMVSPVCLSAYENAQNQDSEVLTQVKDSLGLNYALTGETDKAIECFQEYVDFTKEWGIYDYFGVKRDAWITDLKAGKDPFDAETLHALHDE